MARAYVVALDQGTTSSRCLVFDQNAKVVGSAQEEFRQIFPAPGLVEHDPEDIWESQLRTLRKALKSAGIKPRDARCIGIANQRETVLLWERKSGKPLGNAIVWQDRRTAETCRALKEAGKEDEVRSRSGLLLDPYFSAAKLAWLLDNRPGARERAEKGELCAGTVDSWLAWRLSKGAVHLTDLTNASRTSLLNIETLQWDERLLELFGVPKQVLPEVMPSSAILGDTDEDVAGAVIPIGGIAGDQQAALFGQLCLEPGEAKNTYGTGAFLLANTGGERKTVPGLLTGLTAWPERPHYMLEGSVFVAGAAVQWLRDGLGLIQKASDVETLARSVNDNGGVYFVPALAGLGAPYWDPQARGLIAGLSRGTTKGHLARAALEGVALQIGDLVRAVEEGAGLKLPALRVDGGAAANDLLLQIQADVLGRPVVRPASVETTALGAAFLAGLACGVWSSTDELQTLLGKESRFEPRMSHPDREALLAGWQRAVERSKRWVEPA